MPHPAVCGGTSDVFAAYPSAGARFLTLSLLLLLPILTRVEPDTNFARRAPHAAENSLTVRNLLFNDNDS
jgi:hypothetical protein